MGKCLKNKSIGSKAKQIVLNVCDYCLKRLSKAERFSYTYRVYSKKTLNSVPWVCLQFVIVVFLNHTHYFYSICLIPVKRTEDTENWSKVNISHALTMPDIAPVPV